MGLSQRLSLPQRYTLALAVLMVVSVAGTLGFFSYYLSQTTERFTRSFERQNFHELSMGDVPALTTRLNALTGSIDWQCISARRGDRLFYERRQGDCASSFLQKESRISLPSNDGIEIRFTLRLPRVLQAASLVLILFQSGLMVLIMMLARHAEHHRVRAQLEIALMARQVAHDVRSPLAALNLAIGSITILSEEQRILIRGAVERINDIANDLLQKGRSAQYPGASTAPLAPLMLSSLLDSIVSEKRLQFSDRKGIEIHVNFERGYGLFARVEARELKRAISNLINNSVEAFKDGQGRVLVTLQPAEDRVEIVIEDDGVGIPAQILAKLGAMGVTHGKEGGSSGSGIGVFQAKAVVAASSGTMTFQSTPGTGTRILISLPKAQAPDWFVESLALPPGAQIVILDDDESIHRAWLVRFRGFGLSEGVVEAKCFLSAQGFRDWHTRAPSSSAKIFLVDYELLGQGVNGLDVIEGASLRERAILVTSRFEEPEILSRCAQLGVRLIPKPMVGYVPIRVLERLAPLDAVLIDDDLLVRRTWEISARSAGKGVKTFSSPKDFLAQSGQFVSVTPIYIDSDLGGGVKGEEAARHIFEKGFKEIHLTTGHDPSHFGGMPWLRSIRGKSPPWA